MKKIRQFILAETYNAMFFGGARSCFSVSTELTNGRGYRLRPADLTSSPASER